MLRHPGSVLRRFSCCERILWSLIAIAAVSASAAERDWSLLGAFWHVIQVFTIKSCIGNTEALVPGLVCAQADLQDLAFGCPNDVKVPKIGNHKHKLYLRMFVQ